MALKLDAVPGQRLADYVRVDDYRGYAVSVNTVALDVLKTIDPSCDWIVTGGDDTEPDLNHAADEIAAQCSEHFGGTFGVCQPTGDRWGLDRNAHQFHALWNNPLRCRVCGSMDEDAPKHMIGAYIDRVAGSPWLGREFCLRINQGRGPLWPEYWHMGEDEELQAVAIKYGVFWQRPDLTHLHNHWGREPGGQAPEFLKRANSSAEWDAYKKLFRERRAAGFPGSEPL